jgi:hypothetical protein
LGWKSGCWLEKYHIKSVLSMGSLTGELTHNKCYPSAF